MTIVDRLRYHASVRPHAVAFRFLRDGEHETDVASFNELYQQALRIGHRLHALDAVRERVLLLLPQDLRFVTAFVGCMCSGAVAVPVPVPRPKRPLCTLSAIIRDSEPKIVLTTRDTRDALQSRLAMELPNLRWECIEDAVSADPWPLPDLHGDDLAFLQYTSGSTGSPKGAMVSYANLAHNIETIRRAFGLSESTITGGWLPLYHDMGLVGMVLAPIYLGVQSVLMPAAAFLQNPLRWLRMISDYQITISGGPNFAFQLCVDQARAPVRGLDLSGWRIAFNGAEPVRAATVERFIQSFASSGFRGSSMYACYGLAEATLFVSAGGCERQDMMSDVDSNELRNGCVAPTDDDQRRVRIVGCGRPEVGTCVEIVAPDTGLPVSDGKIGEICIAGAGVTRGYFMRGATATVNCREVPLAGSGARAFLRTGDLGFIKSGVLYVAGRINDMIIIRGRNYFPQDLEETAARSTPHVAIDASVAFSIEHGSEEKLVLVHELRRTSLRADFGDIVLDIQEAIAARHNLSAHRIVLIKPGRIPKTSSGKLRRSACREMFLRNELCALHTHASRDEARGDHSFHMMRARP